MHAHKHTQKIWLRIGVSVPQASPRPSKTPAVSGFRDKDGRVRGSSGELSSERREVKKSKTQQEVKERKATKEYYVCNINITNNINIINIIILI